MKTTNDIDNLIVQHLDYLYHLAYRLTNCPNTAEDIVQDVFIKLKPKDIDVTYIKSPRAWLAAILYRTFVQHLRKEKRSPLASQQSASGTQENQLSQYDIPCNNPGPHELLRTRNLQQHIQLLLNNLSQPFRTIVVMHDVEGYTLRELQEIMDLPMGTLKSRLHRARYKLQVMIEEYEASWNDESLSNERRVYEL